MQKKLLIIVVMSIVTSVVSAQQKERTTLTTWGLKMEVNMSDFIITKESDLNAEMRMGGTFGGFVSIALSKPFALQGELLYHYKASQLDSLGKQGDYHYWGMEIPFYIVYRWKFIRDNVAHVGFGPFAEFGLSSTLKRGNQTIDLYGKNDKTEVSAMNDFNSGFGMMLGYELENGLQVNAGYKISVTNILDKNRNLLFEMYPHTVSLGVAYRFR